MGSFLSATAEAKTPCLDENVYPVHEMDQIKAYRFLLSWTMCFDDVLDAEKLNVSLRRLLQMGDWRKLAGRLRLDSRGRLQVHVPRTFTDEHPAILFHHSSHADVSIDNHALRACFPRPGKHVFVHHYDTSVKTVLVPPHFPQRFDDLLTSNHPQISLHVITFCDATIVQLTWPHTMTDGPGHQALLRNWCLVMAGRETEIQPVVGARQDVLDTVTQHRGEQLASEKTKMSKIELLLFGLRQAWRLWTRPKQQAKMIFIPATTYRHLLRSARGDLDAIYGEAECKGARYISDNDILTAWCSRIVARAEMKPVPILTMSVVNPRYRLPALRPAAAGGVYIQNMSLPVVTQQPTGEAATESVGQLALRARQQISEHATEEQIIALIRHVQSGLKKGKVDFPICGDPASVLLASNNLSPMKLITSVDFSPAVLRRTVNDTVRPPGSMSHCTTFFLNHQVALTTFVPVGTDHEGNFWLAARAEPRVCVELEMELRHLENLAVKSEECL